MPRSSWKGFFIDKCLSPFRLKKEKNFFKVWSRRTTISYHLVNKILYVYTGKSFEKLQINKSMVGFKFGDFVFTKKRGRFIHSKKKLKKISKKK